MKVFSGVEIMSINYPEFSRILTNYGLIVHSILNVCIKVDDLKLYSNFRRKRKKSKLLLGVYTNSCLANLILVCIDEI
jgi:hypothetical protein